MIFSYSYSCLTLWCNCYYTLCSGSCDNSNKTHRVLFNVYSSVLQVRNSFGPSFCFFLTFGSVRSSRLNTTPNVRTQRYKHLVLHHATTRFSRFFLDINAQKAFLGLYEAFLSAITPLFERCGSQQVHHQVHQPQSPQSWRQRQICLLQVIEGLSMARLASLGVRVASIAVVVVL